MKKGQFYFALMSAQEQTNFSVNIGNKLEDYLKEDFKTNYFFISTAFNWEKTKQKTQYWSEIAFRQ